MVQTNGAYTGACRDNRTQPNRKKKSPQAGARGFFNFMRHLRICSQEHIRSMNYRPILFGSCSRSLLGGSSVNSRSSFRSSFNSFSNFCRSLFHSLIHLRCNFLSLLYGNRSFFFFLTSYSHTSHKKYAKENKNFLTHDKSPKPRKLLY